MKTPERKPRDLHSRRYRRYFAQHEEIGRLDEKGRTRIERIYRGDWTVQRLTDRERRTERALLALLYVLAAALFFFAALRELPGNRAWYLSAAHVISFAFLAWTLSGLFNYCGDGARMTVGEYASGAERFRLGSLLSAAAQAQRGALRYGQGRASAVRGAVSARRARAAARAADRSARALRDGRKHTGRPAGGIRKAFFTGTGRDCSGPFAYS